MTPRVVAIRLLFGFGSILLALLFLSACADLVVSSAPRSSASLGAVWEPAAEPAAASAAQRASQGAGAASISATATRTLPTSIATRASRAAADQPARGRGQKGGEEVTSR